MHNAPEFRHPDEMEWEMGRFKNRISTATALFWKYSPSTRASRSRVGCCSSTCSLPFAAFFTALFTFASVSRGASSFSTLSQPIAQLR